jgi:portal protein
MAFGDRIKHAWNAFMGVEARNDFSFANGPMTFGAERPDRNRRVFSNNERTIISSIYNRIGIDAAAIDILHVRLDDEKRYLEDIDSGLNNCLTIEANIDQAARQFRQDIVMTMFEKGTIAIVPVDTTINPNASGSFDIKTMRVGTIVGWQPQKVRVEVYNELLGKRQEVTLDKKFVAIVENPLYSVMNEPNSTLQRLIRKLALLDSMDEQVSSGKLDMIIQLPYVIKSDARRTDANRRRTEIEQQLRGSQYGIAYTDGTEKITQLNRPVENNLLKTVEYLTIQLYSQLGLTPEVMNGTADEATMKNYYNRTVEPIIQAVVEAMKRTFLTKTARSQKQSIMAFRDPFKMVPISDLAEIADKLSRNEIVSANEMRQFMGIKPAKDPKADQLINSNMPQPGGAGPNQGELPAVTDPTKTIDGEVVDDSNTAVQSSIGDMQGMVDQMLSDLDSV